MALPALHYSGLDVPARHVSLVIEGVDSATPIIAAETGSLTLAEERAIFELGKNERYGRGRHRVSKASPFRTLHETMFSAGHSPVLGYGEWTCDGVQFDSSQRRSVSQYPRGYVFARLVQRPRFVRRDGAWDLAVAEDSVEYERVVLPPDGFVVPTSDGLYHPDTGTPFATVRDRVDAIIRLEMLYQDIEMARADVSYFLRGSEGVVGVSRLTSPEGGPFSVSCWGAPDATDPYTGLRRTLRGSPVTSR